MATKNSSRESSGQFRLRIPKDLHAAMVQEAKRQGVSLNSYVLYLLSTRHSQETAWMQAADFYAYRLDQSVREVHDMVLSRTLGEPEPQGFTWRSTGSSRMLS